MLIVSSRLIGCPVLSLHVGGKVATVVEPIIDPHTLKILACRVEGPLVGREVGEILPMSSVREFSRLGMIIDSTDEFVEPEEIIQIRDIIKLNFAIKGLKVETKKGIKLGKAIDYTLEPDTWQVQQVIVQRPFFKAVFDPELTIPRTQIIEITDYKIIVKDEKETIKAKANKTEFSPNFINPFREPDFASDVKTTKNRYPSQNQQTSEKLYVLLR